MRTLEAAGTNGPWSGLFLACGALVPCVGLLVTGYGGTHRRHDPGTSVDGFIGRCDAIMTLNLTDQLHAINLPILVLSGAEDPGATLEAGRIIHQAIAGSRFDIIQHCAHQGAIEQPRAYAATVSRFVQSLG